jgi:hypothetical protein
LIFQKPMVITSQHFCFFFLPVRKCTFHKNIVLNTNIAGPFLVNSLQLLCFLFSVTQMRQQAQLVRMQRSCLKLCREWESVGLNNPFVCVRREMISSPSGETECHGFIFRMFCH